jgi:hypothetical protein
MIRILAVAAALYFAAFSQFSTGPAMAAPVAASRLAGQASAPPLTEMARLYCYNRYSGQFLHWGACGGYYRPHYYYRPRYYHRPRWHYY